MAMDVKLYVPPEFAEQAVEILESEISDEELAAQAEAAALLEEEEEAEVVEEEIEAESQMKIPKATERYEAWLSRHVRILDEDCRKKT